MRGNRGRVPMMLALAGGLVMVPACAPFGAVDGVGQVPSRQASIVEGQIRTVDTRRGRLEVRDGWNRGYTVRYDRDTRVVYRQRVFPVSALERGDVVRVRVVQGRNGVLWADRVDVRESVRHGGSAAGRVARLNGTVAAVDARRGRFTVRQGRQQPVVVYLPHRVSRDDARRFDRLRRGDRVRVEVRAVGRGSAELVRFR